MNQKKALPRFLAYGKYLLITGIFSVLLLVIRLNEFTTDLFGIAQVYAKEKTSLSESLNPPPPLKNLEKGESEGLTLDPLKLSPQEIKALLALKEKQSFLKEQEKALEAKESSLKALEGRLSTQMASLTTLKEEVSTFFKKIESKDQEYAQRLIKIYQNMKPKEAARIFNHLEEETLLNILSGMKENASALILANMDPLRATLLTQKLSQQAKILRNSKGSLS